MKALLYFVLGFTLAAALVVSCDKAHAMGNCPTNYAPLPSHPEVCVPAAKNLTRIDRLVNSCVAYNLNKVQTEYAAREMARTCASLILSGQNWRKAFK
jgi:hypothetical protein